MIKFGILILFIFLIGFISATCNSTQIDINSASSTELDKIISVGPATAAKIIANRTYNSVDDLIRVKGIGNLTLEKIKAQGLACVKEETTNSDEEKTQKQEIKEETRLNEEDLAEEKTDLQEESETEIPEVTETTELPPISLTSNTISGESKDIKTENNKEILKKNLPFYGTIAFCVVFGTAFLLRRRRNKHGFE
jgi:competence ComEA-like helix-hairpin-helix protein